MALKRNKRSPFWWFDFRFQGKRYRGSTGERSKAAAATVEAAELTRRQQGIAPSRSAKIPTLREYLPRFLHWAENSHSIEPRTKLYYTFGARLLGFTTLMDVPLDRLSRELVDCITFRRPIMDRRTKLPTGAWADCSPAYSNQAIRTLKVVLGMAVEQKLLHLRPTLSTRKERGRKALITTDVEISLEEQLQRPEKHSRHKRDRQRAWVVTVCLQDAGMRPGELFPMLIENLRFDERRIWIPGGKTEASARFVGMSERMHQVLKEWVGDRTAGRLFPSARAKCGHLTSIAKSFRGAKVLGGIAANVVPYSARHTYGTQQMEAGGNLFAVSKSMGHASVKSMEPYQHPDTATLNGAIDKRNQARELRKLDLLAARSGHTFGHTTEAIQ